MFMILWFNREMYDCMYTSAYTNIQKLIYQHLKKKKKKSSLLLFWGMEKYPCKTDL